MMGTQTYARRPAGLLPMGAPAPKQNMQRTCACGKPIGPTGECAECRRQRTQRTRNASSGSGRADASTYSTGAGHAFENVSVLAARDAPAKALGEDGEEQMQEKPPPEAGSATIKCDGKGGYEIVYNGWSGAACDTKKCVTVHESLHMDDWKAKWPDGCKDQPKGYLPKGDPPDKPLMTVAEYQAFLKQSECKAHTADLNCALALPKPEGCKKTVDDYIDLTRKQKAKWCPSPAAAAASAVSGAVAGAAVGAAAGSGIAGALAGAAAGAAVRSAIE